MSDSSPPPEPPLKPKYTVMAMLMMATGFVLLLPGACALLFALLAFSDPYVRAMLPLMLVCLLISAGGIWLMSGARHEALQAARDEASRRSEDAA